MAAVRMPGHASGSFDPEKALPRAQAAARGGVTNIGGDCFKASLDRLDNERDVRDRGGEQQPLEREWQRLPDDGLKGLAERRAGAER